MDAVDALTKHDCVDSAGHSWIDGARGILGEYAEHEQICVRCPIIRRGLIHTNQRGAQMAWIYLRRAA